MRARLRYSDSPREPSITNKQELFFAKKDLPDILLDIGQYDGGDVVPRLAGRRVRLISVCAARRDKEAHIPAKAFDD
jgi:hypothetical protein